ncbi:hypothetical protein MKW92_019576 [Papaver armeniacum]|nr:hypothetical protein MKW92_019576 [Papaver armeniacum]
MWQIQLRYFGLPIYDEYQIYEVLTVEENKWRRIHHEVPQYDIQHYGASVYSNGVIYFTTAMLNDKTHKSDKFMVAFDVDTEKFRSIKIPYFVFNQRTKDCVIQLLEVDCCLALITRNGVYIVKVWVKYQENEWEEVPIKLSSYRGRAPHHKFYSLGTDQIISHCCPGNKVRKGSLNFYGWRNRDDVKISKIQRERDP